MARIKRQNHGHLGLLAVSLVVFAGCQPDAPNWRDEYTYVWEGEHVSVYGYERGEEDACGGSLGAVDRHSASLVEFFGFDESLHYDYRWMSQQIWEGKCPPEFGACTAAGVPHTRTVPDMHETAHAVSYTGRGRFCPSVIEEGLAEYFAEPRFYWRWWTDPELPGEIGELLTAAPVPFGRYRRAGHFASFLVESYGSEAVAALCEAIPFDNAIEDWEDATRAVLGVELQDLLDDYGSYPLCHNQQYRARLGECGGEPDATADPDEEVVFEVSMDCSDPGTIGPLRSHTVATRRIWFPEEMRTGVFIVGEDGEAATLDFNIQQCAPCSAEPDLYTSTDLTTVFNFRAGMYELILFAEPEQSQTLTIRLAPFP
ncbi:hypothetical protein ENSA5_45630 [Enhygromyxa salina]|uniref:Lipoprotein n=1 Tax=Enhygromyxa salina TaxID=215803 RepID=A0A2S9XK66_9BACT|nr:hypothetical protein [Enhygromyxa salina]PRP93071.1 hypothetical protein ENSA5_45630 [Enhygromyxa salina]